MANTYLTKTFASDSNRKTWTWSAWIKRSKLGGVQTLMTQVDGWNGNGNAGFYIIDDQLTSYNFTSSLNAGTDSYNRPSRYLRDVNGFYHIVVRLDTTQSTASDRCRWYVNGEQLTDFAFANYPSLNQDCNFNGGDPHGIGSHTAGANYFDGSMTHVHFTDGYSYDPSAFGETDATTGEWEAKTSPSVNYGTHGFLILKDGNTITDQSSNSNDFTLAGGTLTDLKDNPDNVFATLNPLNGVQPTGGLNLTNGNTVFVNGENGSNYSYVAGTLGASSGKFYWETKVDDLAEIDQVGVALASASFSQLANSTGLQGTAYGGKGFQFSNGNKVGDGSQSAYMGGFSVNDIAMIALDLDNNKITFGRNGQWSNGSGGADQTYANSTPAYTNLTAGEFYVPAQAKRASGANYGTNSYNFGNGYFGTTAITTNSGNGYAGAEGSSKFNYTVPTGYSALSTKGLNL